MPEVLIADLHIRQDDLVVAVQGLALWILDDLTSLHQISKEAEDADYYLFKPQDGIRDISLGYPDGCQRRTKAKGILMNYLLNKKIDERTEVKLKIIDGSGAVIRAVSSADKEKKCGLAVKQTAGNKSRYKRLAVRSSPGRIPLSGRTKECFF